MNHFILYQTNRYDSVPFAQDPHTMELDGYETDLADYQLQETPFYETNTVYDIAMLRAAEKFAAIKTADADHVPMDMDMTVIAAAMPTKKKRVTFLPNFVEVRASTTRAKQSILRPYTYTNTHKHTQ